MQQPINLNPKRIESIDLLRGAVMIIMALDHTRDLFHEGAFSGDPLNPATTTPILYFTRWITHLCAPTFVFLSGLSAWLQGQRKTKKELSRFLITRGLWLILADLTIMSLGLSADIHFGTFILETLWSIGISMVLLGLFIWLPFQLILLTGLVIFFGHNLLDFAEKQRGGVVPVWWGFLHRITILPLDSKHALFVLYPFLSWTGLMLLGYCCGRIFTDIEPARRKKILLWTGIGLLVFFAVLRATNVYGDPGHWSRQKNGLYTFLSFMNVQKYPPSLLFLSATIGPGLIFLALIKNTGSRLAKIISVYGRVPFFYFIVHFYILHAVSIALFLSRGHSWSEGINGMPGSPVKFAIPGEGFPLWGVYLAWVAILLIMYPLCKRYDAYKTAHKEKWWLSYL
jgi:uncharacterized membrane protein